MICRTPPAIGFGSECRGLAGSDPFSRYRISQREAQLVNLASAAMRRLAAEPAAGFDGIALKADVLAHCAVHMTGTTRTTDDPCTCVVEL